MKEGQVIKYDGKTLLICFKAFSCGTLIIQEFGYMSVSSCIFLLLYPLTLQSVRNKTAQKWLLTYYCQCFKSRYFIALCSHHPPHLIKFLPLTMPQENIGTKIKAEQMCMLSFYCDKVWTGHIIPFCLCIDPHTHTQTVGHINTVSISYK